MSPRGCVLLAVTLFALIVALTKQTSELIQLVGSEQLVQGFTSLVVLRLDCVVIQWHQRSVCLGDVSGGGTGTPHVFQDRKALQPRRIDDLRRRWLELTVAVGVDALVHLQDLGFFVDRSHEHSSFSRSLQMFALGTGLH